jgi:ABC-type transport system substrate-binding protein
MVRAMLPAATRRPNDTRVEARSYMPRAIRPGSVAPMTSQKCAVDLEKARQLMAASSAPKGFVIDFYVYSVVRYRQYAEVIANNLRSIGITANITMLQYAALRDKMRSGEAEFVLSS